MKNKIGFSLYLLLCFVSQIGWSQVLSDPTRPPPGIGDFNQSAGLMSYPQVKGLQSVIISPKQCAAIIDGRTIELGAKYGIEKLVEVNEHGVVLQGADGKRSMTLFPAVGMKVTKTTPGQQLVRCALGQSKKTNSPAKQAGPEEKK